VITRNVGHGSGIVTEKLVSPAALRLDLPIRA
jgi:hypothetical protein